MRHLPGRRVALLLLLTVLAAGCGQKGDLFLPEDRDGAAEEEDA